MAEKCFGCISLKTLDDICSPDRSCHDNKSSSPISRGPTTGKSSMLRIVHVGGDEEMFTEPKSASELLNQYPGHCLTFPDIFIRPWAIITPERRLFPGEKYCLVRSSIVQKLQLELLQNLHGKELVDHNNGAITSEETNTCSLPPPLCMNVDQKPLYFNTRGEDHCMKDFKESSPSENEMKISLPEAGHNIEYLEIENGKNNMEKSFIPPLKKRTYAAYPRAWCPKLEPVQEMRSLAEYIR